jgi:hypothetical protein
MKKIFLLLLLFFTSAIFPQKLFWFDGGAGFIQSINLNGTGFSNTLTALNPGFGCAYDASSGFFYYTDLINRQINRVKNDGSGNTVLVTQTAGQISIPRGVAINVTGNKIYWSDNGTGKIKNADLNGTNPGDLVTGLDSPSFVVFDQVNQKIYWVDNGTIAKKIQRCNANGTTVQDFVTGLSNVWGIALDVQGGYLYWIDSGIDKLQKKSITDGVPGNKTDVITGLTGNQRGLVVDMVNSKMYWSVISPPSSSEIRKADLSGSNNVSFTGSLNFPQGLALDWNSSLPVELVNLKSSVKDGDVILSWDTRTEVNFSKFIIERSELNSSLNEWIKTGEVLAAGNSNSLRSYNFIDKASRTGKYAYRLKLQNTDGNFEISQSIDVDVNNPLSFTLSQNYPNPFNPSTKINYNLPSQMSVQLRLYNALGKEYAVLLNQVQDAGFYSFTVDSKTLNLASGIYFYRLTGVNVSGSLTDIKKMILLK